MQKSPIPPKGAVIRAIVDVVVYLLIIFLCVGSMPPGINESHYLPKAKHQWDSTFANGHDIFLDSHDSHFLATLIAGNLTKAFELSTSAWIGRVASWLLLAVAWHFLSRAVGIPRVLRACSLLTWIVLVEYGNMAGEWFVGGFEAKAFAYPLALFALAAFVQDRWTVGWLWMGASVAFHPIVGGWIGISCALLWLAMPKRRQRLADQLPGILGGFLLSLSGIWPALGGLSGPDLVDGISAAKVHVHLRLSHHLNPRGFTLPRVVAGVLLLIAWSLLVAIWLAVTWREQGRITEDSTAVGTRTLRKLWSSVLKSPLGKLVFICSVSVGFSLCGCLIDLLGMLSGNELWSARLLRFYWFRWSDIALPLAISLISATLISLISFKHGANETEGSELAHLSVSDASSRGSLWLGLTFVVTVATGVIHHRQISTQAVPPADQLMMERTGPFAKSTEADRQTADQELPQRYVDWLAACEWIRQHSPTDSLWFTPQQQQSFKWYAQRAEVISWKDVPQDSAAIIEWYRRIEKCAPRRSVNGRVRAWKTSELIALAKRYQFQWVLVDRTYQNEPPLLECKYPIDVDNRSFAIFYIPTALLQSEASDP